jgi:hypothetical protein
MYSSRDFFTLIGSITYKSVHEMAAYAVEIAVQDKSQSAFLAFYIATMQHNESSYLPK